MSAGERPGSATAVTPCDGRVWLRKGRQGGAAFVDPAFRDHDAAGRRAGPSAELLMLALFLLMGGFFAVLLSAARFEPDRAAAALRSLADVFAIVGPLDPAASSLAGGAAEPADGRLRRQRRLLEAGEPLSASDRRAGVVARVRLSTGRLFDGDDGIPRWRWFLLGRLAALAAATTDRRLEILAPAGDPATTQRRLERVAERLTALGAAPENLLFGLAAGDGRNWTFVVRAASAAEDGAE